jgi:hypothetical protein
MDASPYGASTFSGGQAIGPLFQFQTPIVYDIATYLPDSRGIQVLLWRHYKRRARGVNVFVLSDGTVTQDTPTPENSNANVPLPWIINDPLNEYSYVTNWDGTIERTYLDPHISFVYEGGHVHTINQFESDFLSSKGYGANITPL